MMIFIFRKLAHNFFLSHLQDTTGVTEKIYDLKCSKFLLVNTLREEFL